MKCIRCNNKIGYSGVKKIALCGLHYGYLKQGKPTSIDEEKKVSAYSVWTSEFSLEKYLIAQNKRAWRLVYIFMGLSLVMSLIALISLI